MPTEKERGSACGGTATRVTDSNTFLFFNYFDSHITCEIALLIPATVAVRSTSGWVSGKRAHSHSVCYCKVYQRHNLFSTLPQLSYCFDCCPSGNVVLQFRQCVQVVEHGSGIES